MANKEVEPGAVCYLMYPMPTWPVKKGDVCLCGAGRLGVVTEIAPDSNGVWHGVHIEPGWEGQPWQSKKPKVIFDTKNIAKAARLWAEFS